MLPPACWCLPFCHTPTHVLASQLAKRLPLDCRGCSRGRARCQPPGSSLDPAQDSALSSEWPRRWPVDQFIRMFFWNTCREHQLYSELTLIYYNPDHLQAFGGLLRPLADSHRRFQHLHWELDVHFGFLLAVVRPLRSWPPR